MSKHMPMSDPRFDERADELEAAPTSGEEKEDG